MRKNNVTAEKIASSELFSYIIGAKNDAYFVEDVQTFKDINPLSLQ